MKEDLSFEYPLTIRESHLDSFGHVNNATYLTLFEEARWEYITQGGHGLKEVHQLQEGPVILEANLKYRKELKNRTETKVLCYRPSYDGKIGRMIQQIVDYEGKLYCEGSFLFALFDLKKRKIMAPTNQWLQALGLKNPE